MSFTSRTITTGVLAVVCASSIVGGGALSASATPVAPPVTGTQTYVSFVVPDPGSYNRSTAPVRGWVDGAAFPGMTANDYSASLGCDDAVTYPVHKTLSISGAVSELSYSAELPLSLVGHSCTISMTVSNAQAVGFSPVRFENDKGKTATVIPGSIIHRSATGGL